MNDTDTADSLARQWGRNVEAKRRDADINQATLADLTGTTQQTISRVERGQVRPTDDLRVKLAKALGCKAGDLFAYEDDKVSS